jgi:hypothetical protein
MLTPAVARRGRGRGRGRGQGRSSNNSVPGSPLTANNLNTQSETGRIESAGPNRSRGHPLSGSLLTIKGHLHSSVSYKSYTGSGTSDAASG